MYGFRLYNSIIFWWSFYPSCCLIRGSIKKIPALRVDLVNHVWYSGDKAYPIGSVRHDTEGPAGVYDSRDKKHLDTMVMTVVRTREELMGEREI